MTTISDKFNRAFESKEAIRQALNNKGVEVPADTPFADYAEKINSISVDDSYYEKFYNDRTSNGTDMAGLFACYKGESLAVIRNLDTSKATDMSYMFNRCYSQSVFMLGDFDTSNVTNMEAMFADCWTLQYLDLSNFDMTNVTDTNDMFYMCTNLLMILLDNCDRNTISKVINSSGFPTNELTNYRRKISVRGKNVVGLTPPENWSFSYVKTPYEEEEETIVASEEVIQEVIEEQEQLLIDEEATYYDSDNENLMI